MAFEFKTLANIEQLDNASDCNLLIKTNGDIKRISLFDATETVIIHKGIDGQITSNVSYHEMKNAMQANKIIDVIAIDADSGSIRSAYAYMNLNTEVITICDNDPYLDFEWEWYEDGIFIPAPL